MLLKLAEDLLHRDWEETQQHAQKICVWCATTLIPHSHFSEFTLSHNEITQRVNGKTQMDATGMTDAMQQMTFITFITSLWKLGIFNFSLYTEWSYYTCFCHFLVKVKKNPPTFDIAQPSCNVTFVVNAAHSKDSLSGLWDIHSLDTWVQLHSRRKC